MSAMQGWLLFVEIRTRTVYSQLLLYRTLGYTGFRTYVPDRGNFSPIQKQLTVCFVQSGIRIYRISYIPDSES